MQRGYYAGARDEAERVLSWAAAQQQQGQESVPVGELVAALATDVAELEEQELRATQSVAAAGAAAAAASRGGMGAAGGGAAQGRVSPFKGWGGRGGPR